MDNYGTRTLTLVQQEIEDIKDRRRRLAELGEPVGFEDDQIEKIWQKVARLSNHVKNNLRRAERNGLSKLNAFA